VRNRPEASDRIDGAIGELSPFHETHGYYAQGVSPTTATLPEGWQGRLVPLQNANTGGAVGLCLDVHDLVLSKYAANREKDRERLQVMPLDEDARAVIANRIEHDFVGGQPTRTPGLG
jgi:hypothetical protein